MIQKEFSKSSNNQIKTDWFNYFYMVFTLVDAIIVGGLVHINNSSVLSIYFFIKNFSIISTKNIFQSL